MTGVDIEADKGNWLIGVSAKAEGGATSGDNGAAGNLFQVQVTVSLTAFGHSFPVHHYQTEFGDVSNTPPSGHPKPANEGHLKTGQRE